MATHQWKCLDVGAKTKEECRLFLEKHGIENLIHSRCRKLHTRTCDLCKKTVSIRQLDENDSQIMSTSFVINNFNWNKCE